MTRRWVPPDEPLGLRLRSLLVVLLVEAGTPLTVRQLIARIEARGVVLDGRPSKLVSDALRWEVRRGRVVRVGLGVYRSGRIAETTLRRMRGRARVLQEAAAQRRDRPEAAG
ncbi:MAG TPA: hypothetical protein VM345_05730 [Acidimicrobiales bacterium]|jgi:hypothetical protein|nr:hypothetical protein [Acidimicrobiales bacterium]